MIELIALAHSVTTYLLPYLPTLLRLGEKAQEAVVEKSVDKGWGKAQEMWGKIHPQAQSDPALQVAASSLASRQLAVEQHPDDAAKLQSLEIYKTVFQGALQQVLDRNAELAAALEEASQDEVVQRQLARRGSEISGVEQSVEGAGKVTQEAVAEDNSKIINSKQQVRR